MSRIDVDGLIKKYGDRRAFEWFVRAEDKRYLNIARRMIKEERESIMETLKKREIAIMASVFILHLLLIISNVRTGKEVG